jgi:hypothetical protein
VLFSISISFSLDSMLRPTRRSPTRSPSGNTSAVGVGTHQSGVHACDVTGALGSPSWPSSPQPHCGRERW